MIKKDDLEEFLFLYSRLDIFPFTNYEDALVSNYNALDIPFKNYSETIIGRHDYLKMEISENLLTLKGTDKLLYLNFVSEKLKFETFGYNEKNLIDLLKEYDVNGKNLDFNKNKEIKELLHTSFKLISGNEKLAKLKNLNNEYCHYLLNIERTKIINHINNLIEGLDHKQDPAAKEDKDKDKVWFPVGILFASGKMAKYYKIRENGKLYFNPDYSSPKVAEELGKSEYDKHILAIIQDYKGNKNIFNYRSRMLKIISHCNEHDIPVIPYFLERLPPE